MTERNEVLAATAKAMAAIKKVAKDGRNEHDKYNFASIDDFLAMVNPICAEAGLIFHMEEAGIDDFTRKGKFGENAWMRMAWSITVYHVSGQSLPPVKRTVEVLRNGAQAYGSAQSYALKQFLRSYLLIATGDKDDADLQPTDAGVVTREDRPDPRAAEFEADVRQALKDISRETTLEGLGAFWGDFAKRMKGVAADPRVIAAKDKRKADLQAADKIDNLPADDLGGDAIPYEGK